MAANVIIYDKNSDLGRQKTRALQMILEGVQLLTSVRLSMLQTIDGDGSQSAHFDRTASLMGHQAGDYADANAAAKADFDELSSLQFKLTTNTSVTDVNAAILQAAAKNQIVSG